MAKRRSPKQDPSAQELVRAHSWAQFFTSLVDRIGWPGLLVFFFFFAMNSWSTAAQKERFVQLYFLGDGIGTVWPLVVLGVVFAATVGAQHAVHRRRVRLLESELDRIGSEKSELQQELTEKRLQRSNQGARKIEGKVDADRVD